MYKLEPTNQFSKAMKKLSGNEQQAVANKLKILVNDPFHPSLRTKKVQMLKDVFENSVNMDIQLLWQHEGNRIILMIDIGRHDILP